MSNKSYYKNQQKVAHLSFHKMCTHLHVLLKFLLCIGYKCFIVTTCVFCIVSDSEILGLPDIGRKMNQSQRLLCRTHKVTENVKTMTNDAHAYFSVKIRVVCNNSNKFAQSNLGRGPRRGTVAHVRRKVPIGYNVAPKISHKSTPSRSPIPKPASSLDPSDLWRQMASGSDPPLFNNALDRPTHLRTYVPTHAQTDRSSTGKFDH